MQSIIHIADVTDNLSLAKLKQSAINKSLEFSDAVNLATIKNEKGEY